MRKSESESSGSSTPSPSRTISRRGFVGAVLAATALPAGVKGALASAATPAAAPNDEIPIIDTHIHLFDPTRPGGVPWPTPDNKVLYRPALPERYRQIAAPLGVRGAIEVECSTRLEDNQWVLEVAAKDPIMVGTVGNLDPGQPAFREQLARFQRNPLFRGIRYGNLWGHDLGADLAKPDFVSNLKALAEAGLELDTANPNPALLEAVVRVTDKVPELRVVIDHLPQLNPPESGAARSAYDATLRELRKRTQVYVKVSEVLRRVDGRVPEDLGFYRARLEELWAGFGEDRVLYGSDWPNSDQWAEYPKVLTVVQDFFRTKGRAAAEKYFWKNSVAAYRWVRRDTSQPSLGTV